MRFSSALLSLLLARRCVLHHIPTTPVHEFVHAPTTLARTSEKFECFQIASKGGRFPQQRRSGYGEISLSPQIQPPTASSPNSSQITQSTPPWIPSSETIVTAVFRAFITVLTLFNVNITWRIHGKHGAIHCQSPTDEQSSHPR